MKQKITQIKLSKFLSGFELLGGFVAILLIVIFITRDLSQYDTIAGGDYYQIISPETQYKRYFYLWLNQIGQGSFNTLAPSALFYTVWGVYSRLRLDEIFNFPILFILTLSYLSFFYSIGKLLNVKRSLRIILSMIYCFNYFTIEIFSYPWGYTHHLLFYPFIPVLVERFYSLLNQDKVTSNGLGSYVLFNSLAFICYNNLGFLAALLLVEYLIAIVLLLYQSDKSKKIVIRTTCLIALQIFLYIPYIVAFFLAHLHGYDKAVSTEVFGGNIKSLYIFTSNTFIDLFLLRHLNKFTNINPLLFLLPLLVILAIYKSDKKRTLIIITSFIIVFMVALGARKNLPADNLLYFLITSTPLAILRSPEKTAVFLPFFFLLTIGYLISKPMISSRVLVLSTIIILIAQIMKFTMVAELVKRGDGAYTYAINIPIEYKEAANIINGDHKRWAVLSIPYSVKNSINWVNYPAWGLVGHDILHLLYNKNYISANTFDHPHFETTMSFKKWGEQHTTIAKDLELLRKFSIGYIFWHKDIPPDRLWEARLAYHKIRRLFTNHRLSLVMYNEYFELYRLEDEDVFPIVISQNNTFVRDVQRLSPVLYKADIVNYQPESLITLNQSYNLGWGLVFIPANAEVRSAAKYIYTNLNYLLNTHKSEVKHSMSDKYSNSWSISKVFLDNLVREGVAVPNTNGTYNFSVFIFYRFQILLYIQYVLILFAIITAVFYIRRNKNTQEHKF